MLKYSPEHMHCLANIYGALAPPNTGILAVQSTAANQKVCSSSPSVPIQGPPAAMVHCLPTMIEVCVAVVHDVCFGNCAASRHKQPGKRPITRVLMLQLWQELVGLQPAHESTWVCGCRVGE